MPVATEVVVDNQDAGFSIVSGEWGTSLAENGNGSYGPDFRYHFADQVDVGVARFTPEVTATGTYTVYIYWSAAADRTTAQPVVIHHADGDTNYTINLQLNGHELYPLGNYTFNAGSEGYVQFTTDTADGFCNADAIRLMPSE